MNHERGAICKNNAFLCVMIPFSSLLTTSENIQLGIKKFQNFISESYKYYNHTGNKPDKSRNSEIAAALTNVNDSVSFILSVTHFITMSVFY